MDRITGAQADTSKAAKPAFLLLAGRHFLCDPQGLLWVLSEEDVCEKAVVQHSNTLRPKAFTSETDALGQWRGRDLQAIPLDRELSVPCAQWLSLRTQLGRIDEALFALAGRALQLEQWRQDHRFCGRCGAATRALTRETARVCPRCELHFYPRLSPCMITLITRGEYCLLARHARSRGAFHTALAGFVEVGEGVEDTVHREIYEEVGLEVETPRYFASQPWPFPGQLMLGFHAEYRAGDIRVDNDEIISADWWRYDKLPEVPPPQTMAGQLIAHFVESQK